MEEVTLLDWEHELAVRCGENRHASNAMKPDHPNYHKVQMEDNLQADIYGAMCEIAVAKYVGGYWSGGWGDIPEKYVDLPDVRPDIEVKRIRREHYGLMVRPEYQGRRLVCTYVVDDRTVRIVGWLPGGQAWLLGTKANWVDTDTLRIVHQSLLHPPSSLHVASQTL